MKKRIVSFLLALAMLLPLLPTLPTKVQASIDYEYAIFPAPRMYLTQIAYESYSHGDQNAIDISTGGNVFAPFTGKIVYRDPNWGYVVLQSKNPVYFADGTLDYMSVGFMHDEDISDLYVGKEISKGTPFYQEGGMGDGNPNAYGDHVHLTVHRGKVTRGYPYGTGDVYAYNAFYIDSAKTTSIVKKGKLASGNYVTNGAPTNWNDLWKNIEDAETLEMLDLGADFYAHIYHPESGWGLNNVDGNVQLGEYATTSSLWRFVRQSDGSYVLYSAVDGNVMDVYNNDIANKTNIWTHAYNYTSAQRWFIVENGSGYSLASASSYKAVDITGALTAYGSNAAIYDRNDHGSQIFEFAYVSAPGFTASTNSVNLNVDGTNSQTITFTTYGNISGRHTIYWDSPTLSGGWGGWTGNTNTLTISATNTDDTYLRIRLYYTDSGEEIDCKYFYPNVTSNSSSSSYTVNYNANGGYGAPSSQTKYHGTSISVSSTVPNREGYTFLGWSTNSAATSASYQPGDSFSTNANTTLYAVWESSGPVIVDSGTCGINLVWTLDSYGKLTISGTGAMYNYDAASVGWWSGNSGVPVSSVVIENGVTSIGYYAFSDNINLGSVSIPKSVTSIGPYAFAGCRFLNETMIPASVTSIGEGAFNGCESVRITVDDNNANFSSDSDGALYNKNKTILIRAPFNTSYTVREGVVIIDKYAFYPFDLLQSVTIPASVTEIRDSAFSCCYNLARVYYGATQEQWAAITIGANNSHLTAAQIHFTDLNGWQQIGGKTYYYKNGVKLTSQWIEDNGAKYYVGADGVRVDGTTLVQHGGQWWYLQNGTLSTANTLVKYGTTWYHVSGGKWVKDNALVGLGGTTYYVKNGTVDFTANGLTYCNGNWYNLSGGKLVKTTTLVNYGGKWWYVVGGVWTKSTTLVDYGGTRYYVKNGNVDFTANTLVQYGSSWYHVSGGKWVKDTAMVSYSNQQFYVKNGIVDFTANGFTYCAGNWYNLSGGKVLKTTTLVNYGGKWWYVVGGVWTKSTTLVNYGGTWYYVKDGIVDFAANTLVKYGNDWYHVKGGKWVKDNALVGLGGTTYYVKNGTVDFTANGLTYCGGNWYNLSGGKLVKTSTLVNYGGKWWYVNNGAWTKATTLVKYGATWYYVKNGIVDFTFNGKVLYGGKYYTVKNGKMVS